MVDKDRIKGSASQAKGKVKEVAGKLTWESKLQSEGNASDVLRLRAAPELSNLEHHLITGRERMQAGLLKGAAVDENIGPAVVSFDEAESALVMKEIRRVARDFSVFVD
jgi:hypothetical protein